MKKIIISVLAVASAFVFNSCDKEKDKPVGPIKPNKKEVKAPETYKFEKNGKSSVSFSGQITRLKMAGELKDALGKKGLENSLEKLKMMFEKGEGFNNVSLNSSGKKLRETVASGTNSTLSSVERSNLRKKMDGWIEEFAKVVIPAKNNDASKGKPGNLSKKRYVNAKGLEANQAVAKTMIGAIMLDQIVNKYISKKYLDDAKEAHEKGTSYKKDANYTKLEHGWDEAYGYVFGLEKNPEKPINKTSERKGFLNSYLKSVEADADFKGIFDKVYNAFKLGRAAIVAKDYTLMHKQAEILRGELSKVVAVRTVHYLLKGKGTKDASTLHALSEAYGFAHAMMFAHAKGVQVGNKMNYVIKPLEGKEGLWAVSDKTLDELAKMLAGYYGFTTEQAL